MDGSDGRGKVEGEVSLLFLAKEGTEERKTVKTLYRFGTSLSSVIITNISRHFTIEVSNVNWLEVK